jgi:hypothetical protein
MVKIKSPLMSERASGTIGGVLTFSHRATGAQVRTQKKQKDVITTARTEQRTKYSEAVEAWNGLTPTEKSNWTRNAKGQNLTGFNLYISIYLNNYEPPIAQAFFGVAIYGESIYAGI